MKGHIRERSPGHWYAVIDLRDAATGKRKRKWHRVKAKGKREAQAECAALITAVKTGTYIEPAKVTLAAFVDTWLADVKSRVSPRTHERYVELLRKNVAPELGEVLMKDLRPAQISKIYADALTSGRRKDGKGLSRRTVLHVHRVLSQALAQAVKWEMIGRNPCDAVEAPKPTPAPMKTYDMEQTAELLEDLRGTRLFPAVLLAVLCGLRRGEICALKWGQVDLTAGSTAVIQSAEQTRAGVRYKEPKSGRSRTVALSSFVIAELKAHRVRQAQELLRIGVRVTDDTFVYAREDGLPLRPHTLTHDWDRKITKTRLPQLRFHDLRHAHATHMLASGVHPKVASERLGHSKIGMTLDLYSHVLPNMQEDAVAKVDVALQAALNKRETKG